MSFTDQDMANAMCYANHRLKLANLKHLYTTHPHIASHVKYRVTRADPVADYYYPASFRHRAVKTEMHIDRRLCEKLSCNVAKPDGVCGAAEEASYYRVGDQDVYERVCQPSCYGLTQHAADKPQMLRLHYNGGRCNIVPPVVTWLEAPLYRSGERYEKRVNDLPVGFNRGPTDPHTATGLAYEYNKTYCDAFFDNWDPVAKDCRYPWHMTLLNAVVGEAVVKLVRAGVTYAESGRKSDIPRPDLPPAPVIEDVWLKEAWLSDVDAAFVPPDVGADVVDDDGDGATHTATLGDMIRTVRAGGAGELTCNQRRQLETKARVRRSTASAVVDDAKHVAQIVKDAILSVMESFTTPEFWRNLGINVLSEAILFRLKQVASDAATRLVPKLMETLAAEASSKLLANVLSKSVLAVTANTLGRVAVRAVGHAVIGICKALANIVSVVGIVLAVVNVFDIILSFWDPLSFNKKYDKEILARLMEQSEFALREEYKTSEPALTFDLLCAMLIDQQRTIELGLGVFGFVYEYLDSLTVNSHGVRIDKGGPVVVDFGAHVGAAPQPPPPLLYTPAQLYRYEREHVRRMRYFAAARRYAVGATALACLCLVAGAHLVGLACALAAVLLIFSLYANACSTTSMGHYAAQAVGAAV